MTVATEACYAELSWTGAETSFSPGFSALSGDHVALSYRDSAGAVFSLQNHIHLNVSKAGAVGQTGAISATPISLPLFPVTIIFERVTPAVQSTAFQDLIKFSARVHEALHDAAAMRAAEERRLRIAALEPTDLAAQVQIAVNAAEEAVAASLTSQGAPNILTMTTAQARNGIDGKWFGMDPGNADNYSAWQAAINEALGLGVPLRIGAGGYKYSQMPTIHPASGNIQGFEMSGNGQANEFPAGTVMILTSDSQDAYLKIDAAGAFNYFTRVRDIGFRSDTGVTVPPTYGVLFPTSSFTMPTFDRVLIGDCGYSVGVLKGAGSNGEFGSFNNCFLNGRNGIFYSDASQDYQWSFNHCSFLTRADGPTLFNINNGIGGAGLDVIDCTGSCEMPAGKLCNNATLLNANVSGSPINFIGGRYEGITRLVNAPGGGSSSSGSFLNFEKLDVTTTFNTSADCTLDAFIDIDGGYTNCNIVDSIFTRSSPGTNEIPIKWNYGGGRNANLRMRRNTWQGYGSDNSRGPYIKTCGYGVNSTLEIDDRTELSNDTGEGVIQGYGIDIGLSRLVVGKRKSYSLSHRAPSGRPSNIIVAPQISDNVGSAVAPAAAWTLTGAATMECYDPSYGAVARPKSQGPLARKIGFAPGMTLTQVLTALDFSSTANAYGIENTNIISWAITFCLSQGGPNEMYLSISDSVSGQIYDDFTQSTGTGPKDGQPWTIVLQRAVQISSVASHPVLTIKNPMTVGGYYLDLYQQYASYYPDPAWSDSSAAPAVAGRSYDMVADSVNFSGVLGIPSVPDAMRLTNSNYAKDFPAEIWASATQNKMVERVPDGTMWVRPRVTSGTAAPTTGAWLQGDQVIALAPAAGGTLGWVCTASGSPGTWKTFGAISA